MGGHRTRDGEAPMLALNSGSTSLIEKSRRLHFVVFG
jgi:hypothetical protein